MLSRVLDFSAYSVLLCLAVMAPNQAVHASPHQTQAVMRQQFYFWRILR